MAPLTGQTFGRWSAPQATHFQRFLPALMADKTPLNTFFDQHNGELQSRNFFLHIYSLQTFTFLTSSHPLLLFLLCTMCFHRWSFIKRGYTVCLGVMLVCLGARLVCLGTRLTIKVSFGLETNLTPIASLPIKVC